MKHKSIVLLITFLLIIPAMASAHPDITNTGHGSLRTVSDHNGETVSLDLPLEHTSVKARVTGFIARVDVTQIFTNNQDDTIEAVYVFPLPDKAAVDAMSMQIGDRTIKGIIKKRQEAEEIYQQARANGQTAALLTQERPNIFTQSVANILPGDRIHVQISYVQDLKYDHGEYEFNFPMVVGPRFIPAEVPDANRITPPVLRPNERSGHDIDLTLFIDAGVPIENVFSPSHAIAQDHDFDNTVTITLDPADSIPNKDFIVRFDVTGKQPEAALQTHHGEHGGFFSLMIQPQGEFDTSEVTPKEMVFVVDCSGSMHGAPMAQAKALMRKAIQEMNPGDSFQIIRFSSSASQFSPEPVANTPANIKRGLAYIDAMSGGGGTMMIEGIKASLGYPADPHRMRMVLFLTDGYIGNEQQILGEIEQRIGSARLFSLGVGSSVNHYLLDRMASAGRGFVQYVRPDEDIQPAVDLFYDRIRNPLLTDIRVDWDGLDINDVYPALIPDLFSEQPVILHGRFGKPGRGTVIISGTMAGQPWEQEIKVKLPAREPANDVLATLWARTRIKHLMDRMNRGHSAELEQEITDLALQYRLMSQYTAFVAVSEEVRRDPDGSVRTVHIPVEMPESVDYEGVFGSIDQCMISAVPGRREKKGVMGTVNRTLGFSTKCQDVSNHVHTTCSEIAVPEPCVSHVDALEECVEDRRCGRLTFTIRSLAGQMTDQNVMDGLENMRQELETLFNSEGFNGDVVVRMTVKDRHGICTIEIVGNRSGNKAIEKKITQLLKKRLTRLPDGEVVVSINCNRAR